MSILARWSNTAQKNSHAWVEDGKDEAGEPMHTIEFCRFGIKSPTNFYLTAGHELAHAIVSHRNQIQAFSHDFYFEKACTEFRQLDVNADFYNSKWQETDIDEFIYQCTRQRCRKIHYKQHVLFKCQKCGDELLCYKSKIKDSLSAVRNESSDDESDDNKTDSTYESHPASEQNSTSESETDSGEEPSEDELNFIYKNHSQT